MSSTMENLEPCFFLEKIPGEMRNRIYDYALLGENGEMTLRSSDMIAPLRLLGEGEQESKTMFELQMLEEHLDATDLAFRKQQSIIAEKKKRATELEDDLHRLRRTVRARGEKTRELERLREEIPSLENGAEQMSTSIEVAKRNIRAIRTDQLLGSRQGESPVFRDMQKLFALSRTCKQIRAECFKLVYEFNKVKFVVGTEEGRTKSNQQDIVHKHLRYISERQLKLAELKMGLIIDFGVIERGPGAALYQLYWTVREYQDRLRKLRKASPSMAIHFQTEEASQQQAGLKKNVSWSILLDTPESVLAQFDARLAAERQWLHQPDVESAKEVLIKIFWPLWAVQNLL
ncbi:hypothetical protein HII31_03403 [Pseudocercospora fuligena]|uniref:Uncharacterized protein n=1 Tax=Pseudocercospora fuligena TaxID=685502 RepID=A0A8H6RQ68_9PEZI|nr:hypothetical protein HII31_03403 [Pseudocercospora fuligena]